MLFSTSKKIRAIQIKSALPSTPPAPEATTMGRGKTLPTVKTFLHVHLHSGPETAGKQCVEHNETQLFQLKHFKTFSLKKYFQL